MPQDTMYSAPQESNIVTLTTDITASADVISVDNTASLPEGPNLFTIGVSPGVAQEVEVIRYAAKTANSLTGCERGFYGTSAKAWSAGTTGARSYTSYDHNSFKNNIADINANYVRQPGFAVTTGSSTAYTVALSPAPTAIPEGFGLNIVPHVNNTGPATVTLSGNTIPLKKQDGSDFAASELVAGQVYSFRKFGANFLAVNARKEVTNENGGGGEVSINGAIDATVIYKTPFAEGDTAYLIPDYSYDASMFTEQSSATQKSCVYSADGSYLFVGGNKEIVAYKPIEGVYTRVAEYAVSNNIEMLAVSKDGSLVVAQSLQAPFTQALRFEDEVFTSLTVPTPAAGQCVTISDDASIFITGASATPYIHIYYVSGNTVTKQTNPATLPTAPARNIAISPDGNCMAVAAGLGLLVVYRRAGNTFSTTYAIDMPPTYGGQVLSVAFNYDGSRLVIGMAGGWYTMYAVAHVAYSLTRISSQQFIGVGDISGVKFMNGTNLLVALASSTSSDNIYFLRFDYRITQITHSTGNTGLQLTSFSFTEDNLLMACSTAFNSSSNIQTRVFRAKHHAYKAYNGLNNVLGSIGVGVAKSSGAINDEKEMSVIIR